MSTTIAVSIADSGMEYLTNQLRKRVGPWSNKRRVKDILACVGRVRFVPIADMCGSTWEVRFVPIAEIPVRSHTALVIVTGFPTAR